MPLAYVELAIDVLINSFTLSLHLASVAGIASDASLTRRVSIALGSHNLLILQFSWGWFTIGDAHVFPIHAYFRFDQCLNIIGMLCFEDLLSFLYFWDEICLFLKECKLNSVRWGHRNILDFIEKRPEG